MKSKAQQFRQKNDSRSATARVTPPHLDRKKARASASTNQEVILHFASSAFLNSPDPSKLPIPDFDDDEEVSLDCDRLVVMESSPMKTASVIGKTDTLKQFLNIRPVSN